jgi:hypothetical protein
MRLSPALAGLVVISIYKPRVKTSSKYAYLFSELAECDYQSRRAINAKAIESTPSLSKMRG